MSMVYRLASSLVKVSGVKKNFTKTYDEILAYARKQNSKHRFCARNFIRRAARKNYHVIIDSFQDCPLIRFQKNNIPAQSAVLHLYGGGMITGPDRMDFQLAERIMEKTARDVWFFYYPLCIEQSILRTYEVSLALYESMLEIYAPTAIDFIGFSSGACLALGILLYNNTRKHVLPMPGQVIAVSPGGLPDFENEENQELIANLEEYSKKDILVDAKYFKTAREILKRGEDMPEYMLDATRGDFTNFPKTHFYYGADEALYTYAPYFERAYEEYGREFEMTVGEGLCHCYPLLRFFKEGREAQDDIIEKLKLGKH